MRYRKTTDEELALVFEGGEVYTLEFPRPTYLKPDEWPEEAGSNA